MNTVYLEPQTAAGSGDFEKKLSEAHSSQTAALVRTLSALTREIQAGNTNAFEVFYDTSKNYVYNNIRGLSSSLSDEAAEDIMQEVYIKAFSNIASLNDPRTTLKWLKTITLNTARDYFKKSSFRHESLINEDEEASFENAVSESDLMSPIPVPENIVEDAATRKLVADVILSLPEKQRVLLTEFYYNGRSIKEIAAELGTSEGAVKTQLSRARGSLKNTFLKIEKDQGIRLHSVGIIPFIFFIFYILMQQRPVSEAVGGTVKAGVFSSAAFKNAADAALTASGRAADDVSQGRAVSEFSESAKAARCGEDTGESISQSQAASELSESTKTAKKSAKAAKAGTKAAKGGAKTAGLSGTAKAFIIGISAAVVIGAAAATAVVIKNNNESEIAAEAETETETAAAETEETAAETEEETTTEEVDETTLMYQLYYDKILELEETWGAAQRNVSYDDGYVDNIWITGFCLAYLVDLDGDGMEELVVGCGYYSDPGSSDFEDYSTEEEIWAYEDGALERIYSEGYDSSEAGAGAYVSFLLTQLDGTYYIVNGQQDETGSSGGTYELYGYSDGEFYLAKTLVFSDGEYSIDSRSVSYSEASDLAEEIWANAESYYFSMNWYNDHQTDPDGIVMVDNELETTLNTLRGYLGIE